MTHFYKLYAPTLIPRPWSPPMHHVPTDTFKLVKEEYIYSLAKCEVRYGCKGCILAIRKIIIFDYYLVILRFALINRVRFCYCWKGHLKTAAEISKQRSQGLDSIVIMIYVTSEIFYCTVLNINCRYNRWILPYNPFMLHSVMCGYHCTYTRCLALQKFFYGIAAGFVLSFIKQQPQTTTWCYTTGAVLHRTVFFVFLTFFQSAAQQL